MDSLSQIVLGAAVGEAVLGRRIGNRAMIWGAVAGTIPDMDVLGKYFLSELDNLAFHRGISHSLLFCLVGSLVFGWVTDRLYRSRHHAWLALGTKAAAAVVVGFVVNFLTQIFAPGAWWPFLLCLFVAARFVRHDSRRQLWNRLGLTWSCLYLALTVVNHSRVQHTVEAALQDQGRSCEQFLITPTIFNNFLWNVVVDAGDEFLLA
jgi:inner membrane protein